MCIRHPISKTYVEVLFNLCLIRCTQYHCTENHDRSALFHSVTHIRRCWLHISCARWVAHASRMCRKILGLSPMITINTRLHIRRHSRTCFCYTCSSRGAAWPTCVRECHIRCLIGKDSLDFAAVEGNISIPVRRTAQSVALTHDMNDYPETLSAKAKPLASHLRLLLYQRHRSSIASSPRWRQCWQAGAEGFLVTNYVFVKHQAKLPFQKRSFSTASPN